MKIRSTSFLKFLVLFFLLSSVKTVSAAITIDSLKTTPSTCANNGTITVYAHAGSSLLYSIISGPSLHALQVGTQFASLTAGTYQVMITDIANDTAKVNAIVTGSYTAPNFTLTYRNPTCPGTSTGMIVGTPQHSGTPPFSWVLTNNGTSATITQSIDTFRNLPAGSYTLRQYDSCLNFVSYSVTLTAPNAGFTFGNVINNVIPCDSVMVGINIYEANPSVAQPYIVQMQTPSGTYVDTFYNTQAMLALAPHTSYGDYINISITNACGVSINVPNTVAAFNIHNNYTTATDSCQVKFYSNFYVTADSAVQTNVNQTNMPTPVTIVVSDPITGVRLDSTVTNDTSIHSVKNAYTGSLTANQNYTVRITDGCGHTYTHNYFWPPVPTPIIFKGPLIGSCMDSTSCYELLYSNTFYSPPTVQLLSGPTSIHSTKPHYTYSDTILYPQSFPCSGGPSGYILELANLAAGTYHFRISDSCGRSYIDSFTIRPQDLNAHNFKIAYIKGCPGQNTIIESHDQYAGQVLLNGPLGFNVGVLSPDTLRNMNSGSYVLSLSYLNRYSSLPVNHNLACPIIKDTFVVPPYTSPLVSSSSKVKCHGSVYVVFNPDSTTGVFPYKYEILSGPQIFGIQYSNTFLFTRPGTYVARISDSCGFANTLTFTVDTSSLAQITRVGSSCPGGSATLSAPASPYITYLWKLPSGTTLTGNSITINPVTAASYGTYTIGAVTNVNGCRDTLYTPYSFTSASATQVAASVCPGTGYLFAGIMRYAAGTYFDTIPHSPCDSIVQLTLTIKNLSYDSVVQNICPGQSVSVGIHSYNTTGIYHDTIHTSGCDSIHVLNLHMGVFSYDTIVRSICQGSGFLFNGAARTQTGYYNDSISTSHCDSIVVLKLTVIPLAHDSIVQSICAGQSYTVGIHRYTTAGIYHDTIATSGCDSIVVLNLHIIPLSYDSVVQNICPGQSVTVGTHIYNTTGIYHDTIHTTGCDSIHVLNLHMGTFSYDTITRAICRGTSTVFAGQTLSIAGTYYDTIPTSHCDSIVVFRLSLIALPYDSVVQNICPGQSVSVGINSYNTTGIYRDTIHTAGCDSIHVLNLHMGIFSYDTIARSICQGSGFLFNGVLRTQAGYYNDSIATSHCDSIVVLKLTVIPLGHDSIVQSICAGQAYTVGIHHYTASGIYHDTLVTSGCDSIVVLNLSIIPLPYDSVVQNICPGQSVTVGIHTYNTTGIYHDTIHTTGCDSIHVLNLHMGTFSYDTITQAICRGTSTVFAGQILSLAGTYYDTVPTSHCDSIVVFKLSFIALPYDSVVQNICPGQSVNVGVHSYSTTGIYHDTIPTTGCDSIHVLNLRVGHIGRDTIFRIICPGTTIVFGGLSISLAGAYSDTIHTSACDSIVLMNLSIRGPLYDSASQFICPGQSVVVGAHTYSARGLYRDTIYTSGCDSIHVLNLQVGSFRYDTLAQAICAGSSYLFGSRTLTLAGTYFDSIPTATCDSIVVLNLSLIPLPYDSVVQNICPGQSVSVGTHTYSTTGIYHDTIPTAGCDSIHVLNLQVGSFNYDTITSTICQGQSISVATHVYNTTGTYYDTLPTSHCDSIIITRLTVIVPAPQTLNVNGICVSIYRSNIYTSDTVLKDTLLSVQGCDSIYLSTNIHITIPVARAVDTSVCIYAGQNYTVGGLPRSTPGIYADTARTVAGACDSLITRVHLQVITPQYTNKRVDSCYFATIGGITYTHDTIVGDTIRSQCGLDSVIYLVTLHFFDPSISIISTALLPLELGQSTQLVITPSGNYQNIIWSPDYELSNIFAASPTVAPRHDTTYTVTAEDAQHCTVTAQILIPVIHSDMPDFIMPTAFSPNGDGKNDLYRPVLKLGPIEVLSFQIFDRWGQKVYDNEVTGVVGWDGTYKNIGQPIGVYVYYITVKVNDGTIVRQSGNLTLLR